jgi:hypothetical protein
LSFLSSWAVDSQTGRQYIPAIAEAAPQTSGNDRSKALRNKRNFASQIFSFRQLPKVENRVLTDGNVSNKTPER